MTASFLLFAILIGVVGGMQRGRADRRRSSTAPATCSASRSIIGIARGITVVMNNGQITDTVLHWAEKALGDVGEAAFAVVMYLLFLPLSFLIPSSSGLATVAMPIMAPLADFAGVTASLVVTAYQSASRPGQPGHPDLRRRHGRARHRPRPLRQLPALGVAAAGGPGRPDDHRARPRRTVADQRTGAPLGLDQDLSRRVVVRGRRRTGDGRAVAACSAPAPRRSRSVPRRSSKPSSR